MVIEGRTWLELLTPAQCWELLAQAQIGRVAVMVDGRPEIYPVNFAVDGESVVFRTDPGSKLRSLLQQPETSFEADALERTLWSGWSVLVKGRALEVTDVEELERLSSLALRHWAYGDKSHWVRIAADAVTGRRLYRPRGSAAREGGGR
jgi:nitroimidazol reductase NimA-like FMN-containing flavoprotein (pyridoxamine 5'-phosphate oxidase superfamily)